MLLLLHSSIPPFSLTPFLPSFLRLFLQYFFFSRPHFMDFYTHFFHITFSFIEFSLCFPTDICFLFLMIILFFLSDFLSHFISVVKRYFCLFFLSLCSSFFVPLSFFLLPFVIPLRFAYFFKQKNSFILFFIPTSFLKYIYLSKEYKKSHF